MNLSDLQNQVIVTKENYNEAITKVETLMKPHQHLVDTGLETDEEKYFILEEKYEDGVGAHAAYEAMYKAETDLLTEGFRLAKKKATAAQAKELAEVWEVVAGNKLNFKFRNEAIAKFM